MFIFVISWRASCVMQYFSLLSKSPIHFLHLVILFVRLIEMLINVTNFQGGHYPGKPAQLRNLKVPENLWETKRNLNFSEKPEKLKKKKMC